MQQSLVQSTVSKTHLTSDIKKKEYYIEHIVNDILNLEKSIKDIFRNVNYHNFEIVIAGGFLLNILEQPIKFLQKYLYTFHKHVNDIDIYIIHKDTNNIHDVDLKILENNIFGGIKNLKNIHNACYSLNIKLREYKIQIIKVLFKSENEVMDFFDLGCCKVYYSFKNKNIVLTESFVNCSITGYNILDCSTYKYDFLNCVRIIKYWKKGFGTQVINYNQKSLDIRKSNFDVIKYFTDLNFNYLSVNDIPNILNFIIINYNIVNKQKNHYPQLLNYGGDFKSVREYMEQRVFIGPINKEDMICSTVYNTQLNNLIISKDIYKYFVENIDFVRCDFENCICRAQMKIFNSVHNCLRINNFNKDNYDILGISFIDKIIKVTTKAINILNAPNISDEQAKIYNLALELITNNYTIKNIIKFISKMELKTIISNINSIHDIMYKIYYMTRLKGSNKIFTSIFMCKRIWAVCNSEIKYEIYNYILEGKEDKLDDIYCRFINDILNEPLKPRVYFKLYQKLLDNIWNHQNCKNMLLKFNQIINNYNSVVFLFELANVYPQKIKFYTDNVTDYPCSKKELYHYMYGIVYNRMSVTIIPESFILLLNKVSNNNDINKNKDTKLEIFDFISTQINKWKLNNTVDLQKKRKLTKIIEDVLTYCGKDLTLSNSKQYIDCLVLIVNAIKNKPRLFTKFINNNISNPSLVNCFTRLTTYYEYDFLEFKPLLLKLIQSQDLSKMEIYICRRFVMKYLEDHVIKTSPMSFNFEKNHDEIDLYFKYRLDQTELPCLIRACDICYVKYSEKNNYCFKCFADFEFCNRCANKINEKCPICKKQRIDDDEY